MAANKAKTPSTGANGTHTVDIPHEEVPNKADSPAITPKVITVEDQIRLELAKFNLADSKIAEMKQAYGGLVISGPDDKDGYKAVKEAWNDTRSRRTGLEKKGLELRGGYGVITKAIKKEEDRLIELLTPLEDELYKKWKAIDDEKERAKKEKEEAEQRELMVRVEEVMNMGMTLKDGMYVIGDTISVDVASLRAMPADQYEKFKAAVQAKAAELKKIADDLAEKKRQEEEKLRQEQEKLRKHQEEFAEQLRQFRLAQDKLEQDRQAAARMKKQMRTNELVGMGMEQKHNQFVFDNGFRFVGIDIAEAHDMEDADWVKKVEDLARDIKESKDAKALHDEQVKTEKEALDLKKKFIDQQMTSAGLTFSYTGQSFNWEDKNTAISMKFDELIPMSEDDIIKTAKDLGSKILEAKKLTEERDRQVKEAQQREEKLALNDRDRLFADVAGIEALLTEIKPEEYKTKKFQGVVMKLKTDISNILNSVK